MCVSYRLICQCVIRVSCYENYTRNTQTALVCTLLPVSYMLRCACWTSVCTKLCRRGQDVEHHRRARCDGSSAPCSGGPQISPHSCAAGAEGPLILAATTQTFPSPARTFSRALSDNSRLIVSDVVEAPVDLRSLFSKSVSPAMYKAELRRHVEHVRWYLEHPTEARALSQSRTTSSARSGHASSTTTCSNSGILHQRSG